MRRTLFAALLSFLLLAPAASALQAPDHTPLKAGLATCLTGATPGERFAVFTGSMPAYAGTRRMAMRFQLQTRPIGGRSWTTVHNRRLERWERSDPGRSSFTFSKRVEGLPPGNEYRALVRFRWYQGDGTRRPDRVRRTPVCFQPDPRPNLIVQDVRMLPGASPLARRYVVTVLNQGVSAARSFGVGFRGAGTEDTRRVSGLAAGEQTDVEFTAPPCASGSMSGSVDVGREVDESSESDNTLAKAC